MKQKSNSSPSTTAVRSKIIHQRGAELGHRRLLGANPHPAVASTDSLLICVFSCNKELNFQSCFILEWVEVKRFVSVGLSSQTRMTAG